MQKSLFELNGGTYRQVGDFLIPNLTLPPEETNIRLGKWGMLHKNYLLKNKKVVFATLLAEGKLWQHLADILILMHSRCFILLWSKRKKLKV